MAHGEGKSSVSDKTNESHSVEHERRYDDDDDAVEYCGAVKLCTKMLLPLLLLPLLLLPMLLLPMMPEGNKCTLE